MKEYTHKPTPVKAIQVSRPFRSVQREVPTARMVKTGSGAFDHFRVSQHGSTEVKTAREGDWIVRYPNGDYHVFDNLAFEGLYGSPDAWDGPGLLTTTASSARTALTS